MSRQIQSVQSVNKLTKAKHSGIKKSSHAQRCRNRRDALDELCPMIRKTISIMDENYDAENKAWEKGTGCYLHTTNSKIPHKLKQYSEWRDAQYSFIAKLESALFAIGDYQRNRLRFPPVDVKTYEK